MNRYVLSPIQADIKGYSYEILRIQSEGTMAGGRWQRKTTPMCEYLKVRSSFDGFSYKQLGLFTIFRGLIRPLP